MDLSIFILELIQKMASELGVFVSLSVLTAVVIWSIKDTKVAREKTDSRLDRIEERQKEMSEEYQKGFEDIHRELEAQRKATESSLANLNHQQEENTKMTLRSMITNEALPREYRMKNYDHYKSLNGNSWIDEYYDKYLKNDK